MIYNQSHQYSNHIQYHRELHTYLSRSTDLNDKLISLLCKAKISVYHLDQWIEIGRYVTPYGIECGWNIDVTDYRSLFKGEVQIRSFIDTWVQPGWLVSIEFDFVSGSNEYPYTVVRNLWNYDRLVYGDPTIPIDIATINEYLPNDTEEAYIRITTTGHGQGLDHDQW